MDAFLDQFFNLEVMAKYLPDIIDGLWVQTGPFLSEGVKQIGLTADWRLLHGEIAAAMDIKSADREAP